MARLGLKPTPHTHLLAVSSCAVEGDVEGIHQAMQAAKHAGVEPDARMYNLLLRGHGMAGDLEVGVGWGVGG
jgi:hypothetical protein